MPKEDDDVDALVQIEQLRGEIGVLRASHEGLREHVIRMEKAFERIGDGVDSIRMDLHAAKVGGRWLMGVALAVGGVLGWAVKLYFEWRAGK